MTDKAEKPGRGEMRRRHEAIIRSGALARLRSEGRLVFALALCWADYKTCQFRMSARGAAKTASVQPTAIRRGIAQLVAAGVIVVGRVEEGRRQVYMFSNPPTGAHGVCAGGARGVRAPLTQGVRAPDTYGAQGAHTECATRTPPVSAARTGCAP